MPESIPFDAFYDFRRPSDVELSPDGERAAVVVQEFDPEEDERLSSVFVVPTDGSREPHRLTRASSASSPTWSPDGSRLAVLASREEDIALRAGRDDPGEATDSGEADDERAEDGEPGDDEVDAGEEADDRDAEDEDDENDGDAEDDGDGENGGPDEPRTQVWIYDLELGGDPRQVTDFEEGVREVDWAPDGERLVVSARDPTDEQREYLERLREEDGPIVTERLQHKANGPGWLDDVTTYLFVVDVDSRETERLEDAYGQGAQEPHTGLQPTWSPGGDRIAFVSNRTERPDDSTAMDIYTIAPDGSDLTRVTDGDVIATNVTWGPSGDRIAFVSHDPENFYVPAEVYVSDPAEGTYPSVSANLDRTVAGYRGLRWLDDGRPDRDRSNRDRPDRDRPDRGRLVGCIGDEGLTRPAIFDAAEDAPERAFPIQGTGRDLALFDCRGGTVLAGLSHPGDGIDLYAADESALFDPEAELTRLTALNEDLLAEIEAPSVRRIEYDNGEDETVEAIVYHPDDFDPDDFDPDDRDSEAHDTGAPDPRGLILSIHGGPMAYDAPGFDFTIACWTSRGYLVAKPNYRGSTSYGREFCETLRGEWGTKEVVDQAACVEALIDRGWVDPGRTFSTGFSYGAISTGYLITQTDLFTAAAAEHGLYDLRSSFGTDDCHIWWEQEYGLPWEDGEAYEAASSITDVGDVDTPLLVTAGENDWRCPPTQSEQLYVSVRKQGVPARLVVYRDEHHAVSDPDRAIHRLNELTGWFERFDPAVETDEDDPSGDRDSE